jgi:NADH-quinone oxidoreductase subunit G
MDTVTITLDGRAITVEKGRTVLQAAIEHGIDVPYYCYHPGLGVDGSCRVCIVKIEKMPKLQTACSTVCTDGMVIQTRAPEVVEARASVFEFLLLNHPLDCPVCDKGGECPLQDFSYAFGRSESRTDFPRRVFDGEGVKADVDFGPTLMLNRNRCILCTRCVRFMREVDGDAQIGIIDRGNGSQIATFQEEGVHSLLSGNLMDVCPVGALTTKDYRFKSRPWDNPQAVDSICTSCSKGCNTTLWLRAKPEWAKGARLIRVTPRYNPDVNGYWMCDIGRFGYHWVEGEGRLTQPLLRNEAGDQVASTWTNAFARVGEKMSGSGPGWVRFLASAHASLEEFYVLRRIAQGATVPAPDAVFVTWPYHEKVQPAEAAFKVSPVDAPNLRGARDLGLVSPSQTDSAAATDGLRDAVHAGRVGALIVLDPGPQGSLGDISWILDARRRGALPLLVAVATEASDLSRAADIVLPGASFAEKDASYTNEQGRVQGGALALPPPGDAREGWLILRDLAAALGITVDLSSAADVRAAIARDLSDVPGYADIAALTFARPVEARHWLQASNPSERWKWDFLFQDLPPVKFNEQLTSDSRAPLIPLRKVD